MRGNFSMLDSFYKGKKRLSRKLNNSEMHNIKSGFTLVEVVIVLAVVAIIASLVIPSLIGYIDSSKEKVAVAECRSVVTAAQYLANDEYDEHGTTGDSLASFITEADILALAEEENASGSSLAKMPVFDFSIGIKAYADDEEAYTYGRVYDDISVIEDKAIPEDKSGKSFIESYEFEGYTLSHMVYLSKNGIWLEYKAKGNEVVQNTTVTTLNNSYSVVFKSGDKIISIKNYNSGESVTPPDVDKDGYILKGWNLEKGETKSSLGASESFTVSGSEKKIIYKAVFELSSVPPTTSADPDPTPPITEVPKPDDELPEPLKSGGQLYNIVQNMTNGVYENGQLSTSSTVYEYGGEYYFFPYMQMFYNDSDKRFTVNGVTAKENVTQDDIDEICQFILSQSNGGAKPVKLDLSNCITVDNNFNNWNRGDVISSDGLVAITQDETKAFIYVADWSSWQQVSI